MGVLAEKIRSGGMGVPAFYIASGVGTNYEEGGIPVKMTKGGKNVEAVSDAKEKREFNDKEYILEKTVLTDFAFVKAWKADHKGNCLFKKSALNFNADVASAGKICIVEADEIVETGTIDGEDVELAGIFVHRVIKSQSHPEPIVKRIIDEELLGTGDAKIKRQKILKRAAQEIKDGMYVYLNNGYSKLIRGLTRKDIDVDYVSETGIFGIDSKGNDSNVIDGDYSTVGMKKGSCIAKVSDLFSAIRGNHLSLLVTDAFQVSENGDIANWHKPGEFEGPHCNLDIASTETPLVVLMEHVNAQGKSNIVKECSFPVSGKGCISKLITDMAVFEFRDGNMVLTEISPDVTLEDVKKATPVKYTVEKGYKKMNMS